MNKQNYNRQMCNVYLSDDEKKDMLNNVICNKNRKRTPIKTISSLVSLVLVMAISISALSYYKWRNNVVVIDLSRGTSNFTLLWVEPWPIELIPDYSSGMDISLAKQIYNLNDNQLIRVKFYFFDSDIFYSINEDGVSTENLLKDIFDNYKDDYNKNTNPEYMMYRGKIQPLLQKTYTCFHEYLQKQDFRDLEVHEIRISSFAFTATFTKKEIIKIIESDNRYFFFSLDFGVIENDYDFSKISKGIAYTIENADNDDKIKVVYVFNQFINQEHKSYSEHARKGGEGFTKEKILELESIHKTTRNFDFFVNKIIGDYEYEAKYLITSRFFSGRVSGWAFIEDLTVDEILSLYNNDEIAYIGLYAEYKPLYVSY